MGNLKLNALTGWKGRWWKQRYLVFEFKFYADRRNAKSVRNSNIDRHVTNSTHVRNMSFQSNSKGNRILA